MTSSYSKLFTIELLHEYFLNGKCDGLQIVPAEDAKTLAKKMGLLFRNMENGLVALIKDNGNNGPFFNTNTDVFFRKLYGNTVLRFYVTLANAQFLNYTNIQAVTGRGKKFYFSNLSQNASNGRLYLTAPIKDFTIGTTYLPGDFAKDPISGQVFEAITKQVAKKKNPLTDEQFWTPKGLLHLTKRVEEYKTGHYYQAGDLVKKTATENVYEALIKHSAASKTALDDTTIWMPRGQGQLQYVSNDDLVEYTNGNYIFEVKDPVKNAEVSFLGFNYNAGKPAYDRPVDEAQTLNFKNPVNRININLAHLAAGKYMIKVNKETRLIYYDPQMPGSVLGVIEIFNHLPEKDDFSPLTAKEEFKNVHYQLQFATRSVLWKYIRKDGKAVSISDTGDTGYVFNLNGEAFVSATPIPLSQGVLKTLKLDFNTKDFSMGPLPNPDVQRLGKCTQNDYDYLCSEIFLNY